MKEQIKKAIISKTVKKKETMIILILIGAVLAVMLIPTETKEETDEVQIVKENITEYSEETYREELERRLEEILSQMEGVGKVDVMITMQASAKEVVEKDYVTQESREGDETSLSEQRNISKEETTIYSENSDGNNPYVIQEIYPEVEGVLVVAEGGDNSYVNIAIVEAIQALFDVDVHKIKIVKMNTD